jgi:hypothetical protein
MPPAHICHGKNNVWNEEEVLDAIHTNPLTSSCWVAYEIGLSQNAGWCTLHEEHLYSFHVWQQGLQPGDSNIPFQLVLLMGFAENSSWNRLSLCRVLWTDKATLTRSEVNNLDNLHECLLENPHPAEHSSFCQNCRQLHNWTVHDRELSQWNPVS